MKNIYINTCLFVVVVSSFCTVISSDNSSQAPSNPFERFQRIELNENGDFVEHSLTQNVSRGVENGHNWIEGSDGPRVYRQAANAAGIPSSDEDQLLQEELATSSPLKSTKK